MKKTIKRIITGILAVSTIASSAFLLAGCGEEKSTEEKAKDAIRDAYNNAKSMSSIEESETGTVELNLLDKIISDELYTLKFYSDPQNYNSGFYIRINDTIDIDGYTLELREKTEEYYSGDYQYWDIKKDGENLASFEMTRDTWSTHDIKNNKIEGYFGTDGPFSDDDSEVDFKFTEYERSFEADVPAELTPDECKQHMDELEAMAFAELDNVPYYSDDCKNTKLESVYYLTDAEATDFDAATALFLYSADSYNRKNYFVVAIDRPFLFDGELQCFRIDHVYLGEIAMNSTLEEMCAKRGYDFSSGTKIG